jgi:hypothetical protein
MREKTCKTGHLNCPVALQPLTKYSDLSFTIKQSLGQRCEFFGGFSGVIWIYASGCICNDLPINQHLKQRENNKTTKHPGLPTSTPSFSMHLEWKSSRQKNKRFECPEYTRKWIPTPMPSSWVCVWFGGWAQGLAQVLGRLSPHSFTFILLPWQGHATFARTGLKLELLLPPPSESLRLQMGATTLSLPLLRSLMSPF